MNFQYDQSGHVSFSKLFHSSLTSEGGRKQEADIEMKAHEAEEVTEAKQSKQAKWGKEAG